LVYLTAELKTKKIDRKTRRILTMYKVQHPKADIDRLCKEERRRERTGAS